MAVEQTERPKPKAPRWIFENIAEASKKASRIYTVFLSVLAYCAITVVSTTDRQLLLNEPVRLPLINVEVSLAGFFVLSPIISILIFVYLQLYFHRIKGLIEQLKTDYDHKDKRRIYPWLLNIAREPEPGAVGKVQSFIASFSLWWCLPIVLTLFPLSMFRKQIPFLSYVFMMVPVIGSVLVWWFKAHYETYGLQGKKYWSVHLGELIIIPALLVLIPLALTFDKFMTAPLFSMDLHGQVFSTKPMQQYPGHYWFELPFARLERANLSHAVLEHSNLEQASLQRAKLVGTILTGANLTQANLTEASLIRAQLTGARLMDADLTGANLSEADLTGANLVGAVLTGANLNGVNLTGAYLRQVEGLTVLQISQVKTLYKAMLDPPVLEAVEKTLPRLLTSKE